MRRSFSSLRPGHHQHRDHHRQRQRHNSYYQQGHQVDDEKSREPRRPGNGGSIADRFATVQTEKAVRSLKVGVARTVIPHGIDHGPGR